MLLELDKTLLNKPLLRFWLVIRSPFMAASLVPAIKMTIGSTVLHGLLLSLILWLV